jgi:hypothetical protein
MTQLLRKLIEETDDFSAPTVTTSTSVERSWPPPDNCEEM